MPLILQYFPMIFPGIFLSIAAVACLPTRLVEFATSRCVCTGHMLRILTWAHTIELKSQEKHREIIENHGKSSENHWETTGKHRKTPGNCPGHFPEHFRKSSWKCPGNVWEMAGKRSETCSGKIPGKHV